MTEPAAAVAIADRLEEQVERAIAEIESLRERLCSAEEARDDLKKKLRALEKTETSVRGERDGAVERVESLEADLERVRGELEARLAEDEAEAESTGVGDGTGSEDGESDRADTDADALARMRDDWEQERRELRSRVESLVAGLERLAEATDVASDSG